MHGYSGTPLAKKLGIKQGFRVKVRNARKDYKEMVSPLPDGVQISRTLRKDVDIWHLFTASLDELSRMLSVAKGEIKKDGIIWVSWPKKSSGIPSEVTEDTIRNYALTLGLVDVKVCTVDEIWSGLKLVIRKELRK